MFPPCRLNQRSQDIISNIHRTINNHPSYAQYTVELISAELWSTGCMSIQISKLGRSINMFMFCPNADGNVDSIAIYGNDLKGHFNTISASRNIFGFRVSNSTMDSGYSDFVDVEVAPY